MQREADTFITNNEKAFIIKALQEECRLDGRRPFDFRKPKFQFSLDDSSATLTLGTTRVMTVISAVLEAPFPDRPNEGSIRFNAEFSPMASPAFEAGRPSVDAVELARLIERGLRGSGAVDTEALCVLAGRMVWALRCDMHVLDHGGNLVDACMLCALAACLAFRRPEVVVGGGPTGTDIVVQPKELREPIPLTIHHHPVSTTFALYEDGSTIAVDPSLREQAAQAGSATVMVNTNKEVCAVHKAEGIGLNSTQFMRLVRIASAKADDLVAILKASLQAHESGVPASQPSQPAAEKDATLQKLEQDLDMSLEDSSEDESSSGDSEEDEEDAPNDGQPAASAKDPANDGPGPAGTQRAEAMETDKQPSKVAVALMKLTVPLPKSWLFLSEG
ncbi:ribosomal protein S5 domain 2-type protein [Dunaliella salina]|uniref:Ribosomal protein S5 domain 2-type protein n=1 Tax=Dunaliella salina TaxID=3046 RepID=A0ABQ7H5F0_DUNSA|nr:ribosomal protein S5 domain 2-type protein [Dunaliella salina]|eukprot:KAF5842080.1 ribosomal protein S5 domain 2-type protein [Dunaliella salina]